MKWDDQLSKVFCGDSFTFFLTTNQSVYACGSNVNNQLGLPELADQ